MPGMGGMPGKDGQDPTAGLMDMMKNLYENVRFYYFI